MLEKQNNLAQLYFDLADSLMIAISKDELITDINGKASEILGYSRIEVRGKIGSTLLFPKKTGKRLDASSATC